MSTQTLPIAEKPAPPARAPHRVHAKPAVLVMGEPSAYEGLAVDCFDLCVHGCAFSGHQPVVAQPASRCWGRGRDMRRPQQDERLLSLWMLAQVQRWGGVLMHPANSQLWGAANLPLPGHGYDEIGGWTLPVWQSWFGASVPKPTWVYIVGPKNEQFPALPFLLGSYTDQGQAHHQIPKPMAKWLCNLAQQIGDAQPWLSRPLMDTAP